MKQIDLQDLYAASAKKNIDMFDKLNSDTLAYLKGYIKEDGTKAVGHGNYETFISDLSQIDFLQKVFTARYNLLEGTHEEKLAYALEGKNKNTFDEIFGKKEK